MSSGHYCDDCAKAYYNCVCNSAKPYISKIQTEFTGTGRELFEVEKPIVAAFNAKYSTGLVSPRKIDLYDWDDIQTAMCEIIGIDKDMFRDYHKVVGGEYKDFWHVCLEQFIPDNMSNDSIEMMWRHDDPDCFTGDDAWKNLVLNAWNTVYDSIASNTDAGIYVSFSW